MSYKITFKNFAGDNIYSSWRFTSKGRAKRYATMLAGRFPEYLVGWEVDVSEDQPNDEDEHGREICSFDPAWMANPCPRKLSYDL